MLAQYEQCSTRKSFIGDQKHEVPHPINNLFFNCIGARRGIRKYRSRLCQPVGKTHEGSC